jgi:hypothetical protein
VQAIESACLSLAEFRQRSHFPRARETLKQGKNDITDALKAVFWAYSLQELTGSASPRALERLFEPETFRKNAAGQPFNHNKWRHYFAGRHEPIAALDKVAAKFPGANACLESPLWAALTPRPLTRRQLDNLILPLAPDIQAIVRRRGTEPRSPRFPGMSMDRGLAEALERRASFDALAAAIIMVRISHVEGESSAAFDWGRHVLRILLMLSEMLHNGGIARPLLELVEERVLALAWHDGARPGYPAGSFFRLAQHYVQGLGQMHRSWMTRKQRQAPGQCLLSIEYGWDCFYAFGPLRITVEGAPDRPEDRQFATPDIWLHTWALNMLEIGRHRDAPPDAVVAGLDLWASRDLHLAELIAARFKPGQGSPKL